MTRLRCPDGYCGADDCARCRGPFTGDAGDAPPACPLCMGDSGKAPMTTWRGELACEDCAMACVTCGEMVCECDCAAMAV